MYSGVGFIRVSLYSGVAPDRPRRPWRLASGRARKSPREVQILTFFVPSLWTFLLRPSSSNRRSCVVEFSSLSLLLRWMRRYHETSRAPATLRLQSRGRQRTPPNECGSLFGWWQVQKIGDEDFFLFFPLPRGKNKREGARFLSSQTQKERSALNSFLRFLKPRARRWVVDSHSPFACSTGTSRACGG